MCGGGEDICCVGASFALSVIHFGIEHNAKFAYNVYFSSKSKTFHPNVKLEQDIWTKFGQIKQSGKLNIKIRHIAHQN